MGQNGRKRREKREKRKGKEVKGREGEGNNLKHLLTENIYPPLSHSSTPAYVNSLSVKTFSPEIRTLRSQTSPFILPLLPPSTTVLLLLLLLHLLSLPFSFLLLLLPREKGEGQGREEGIEKEEKGN